MTSSRAKRRTWLPFATRLSSELSTLLDDIDTLLDDSVILNIDPNRGSSEAVFVGFPQWGWGKDGDQQTARRLDLLARWSRWRELFDLLFPEPPPDVKKRINDGSEIITDWLTRRPGDHSVPRSVDTAKSRLRERTNGLLELLAMKATSGGGLIVVPDTNALIFAPDVSTYGPGLGATTYEVHLLSTVSSELDRLKVEGRTPELREKVQGVIRRIKGLRDRGSLASGVSVTKSVRFLSQAREPNFDRMPGWLDRSNNDDRILAAALELQGRRAGDTVVLVTGDLNLQTKADAAGLPYVEPPES